MTCVIGRPYFFANGEIALVVPGHAHHRAFAVGHQHVVADPDFDLLAADRMRDEKARGHAFLVELGEVRPPSPGRVCIPRRRRRASGPIRRMRGERVLAATAQKVAPISVSARVVNTRSTFFSPASS